MASRIYLHAGTMKSGTTYIQALCNDNTGMLAANGLLWLGSSLNFSAVKDLEAAKTNPNHEPAIWDQFAHEIQQHDGPVLVSNEMLSVRPRRRIRALIEAFGDVDVTVILTVRDLGRIVASQWQERVRNRPFESWSDFMERLMADGSLEDRQLRWFWRRQDINAIVSKFAGIVGVANVTIVTVPPSGSEPGLLASRLFSVLSMESPPEPSGPGENASMGAHSVELMRRIQRRLTDTERQRLRTPLKYILARGALTSRRSAEPQIGLTPEQFAWTREHAEREICGLVESGVQIVGDADDLRPREPTADPGADPGATTDAALLDAAVDTVIGLVSVIDDLARENEGSGYGETLRRVGRRDEVGR